MSEREEAARASDELRDLIESLTLLAGGCEFRDAQYLHDDIMRSIERMRKLEAVVERLTRERDKWHRRWWIDKHHGWDSCLWNPQAEHFAEWGYADFEAPSCPHWGVRGNGRDSGCCATAEEHDACWERAADHYMAARDEAETLREGDKYIDIVFDSPPSHVTGRFVEVEDSDGASINFGEWVERPDGYWVLRIPGTPKPSRTIAGITFPEFPTVEVFDE